MEDILIDTDIVIEYLRNKKKSSTELVRLIRKHVIYISAISEFELFLGARTGRHRDDLEMVFNQVAVIPESEQTNNHPASRPWRLRGSTISRWPKRPLKTSFSISEKPRKSPGEDIVTLS